MRRMKPGVVWYVREKTGEGGTDWGYVDDVNKATPLNQYWMRRFVKDMQRIGTASGVRQITNTPSSCPKS